MCHTWRINCSVCSEVCVHVVVHLHLSPLVVLHWNHLLKVENILYIVMEEVVIM